MTVTLLQVRTGLQANLATVTPKLAVALYWPDQVVPPAALIKLPSAVYERSFGGGVAGGTLTAEIQLVVSLQGGLVNAQALMDQYLANSGAASIRAAIAADRTLGGVVAYSFIRGWRDYDTVEINQQAFLGAIVDVEVEHDA